MDVGLNASLISDYNTFPNQSNSSKIADDSSENIVSYDKAIDNIGFGKYQILLICLGGIAWLSDGMEILVLSILTDELKKEWNLTTFQVSFMVSIVFVGSFIGSLVFGFLSDKYGRKKCLMISSLLLALGSILSSFSKSYVTFSIFRFLVGAAFAGNIQIDTYCTEMTPAKYRCHAIFAMMLFWPIGAILAVLLAHFIGIENGLWHQWLLWLSVPPVLFFVFTSFIPESSRFLLKDGRNEEALRSLKKMARINSYEMCFTEITLDTSTIDYQFLTNRSMILKTISLCYLWLVMGGMYYGLVLITTLQIANSSAQFHVDSKKVTSSFSSFSFYLISTAVEIPGILLGIIACELLGRKKILSVTIFIISLFFGMLLIPGGGMYSIIILWIARIFAKLPDTLLYVYTNELYSTNLRSITLGLCNMFYRIGAILTPYVVYFLYEASFFAMNLTYLFWISSALIPLFFWLSETKGKPIE